MFSGLRETPHDQGDAVLDRDPPPPSPAALRRSPALNANRAEEQE